ncbi:MAG TPA: MFS transporter [Candidatus Ruthenibacterium merdigallinarum]|nr:MFS transporter [Candidatus Ruthenibacterium merdigallinarum]
MPVFQTARARRACVLMCLIAFLQGFVLYAPVAALYRTGAGLTLTQIALLESLSYVLTVALEVPLGALCARIGYKRMLVLVNFVFFASKLVFWRAYGFGMFLAERVLMSVVSAGLSGCDDAYLYLAAGPEEAQRAFGRYSVSGTVGLLASSAAFTLLFSDAWRAAALWTAVFYGAAAACALALPDAPASKADRAPLAAQLRGIADNLRAQPRVGLLLAADVLLTISGQTVTVFYSQLLYKRCGVPDAWLGALYVLLTLCALSAGASWRAARHLKKRFGPCVFLLGAAGCFAAGFARGPVLCAAGVFALQFAWYAWQPYSARLQNDSVADGARSVILSGYSMAQNLGTSGLSLALGAVADVQLTGALALAGGLCALGAALAARYVRRAA